MLKRVNDVYAQYKSDEMKFDYTDMIEMFVKQGTAPTLDVLIVDEAGCDTVTVEAGRNQSRLRIVSGTLATMTSASTVGTVWIFAVS